MLVVFTGPSLDAAAVARILPHASVRPPACRGDVAAAVADGAGAVLLLDGGFAHHLAVAPGEIVDALNQGVAVTGASSLGAIRAAECHPAGMAGVGAVARLYRLGVLRDDTEVAVATEPDRGHRAVSVALVNVRFALLRALRAGLLDRGQAGSLLAAARGQHFGERHWPGIFAAASIAPSRALGALCTGCDVKRRDAERAVGAWARRGVPTPSRPVGGGAAVIPRAGAAGAERYPGHDPHLGQDPARLRGALLEWLVAGGRGARYWSEPPGDPGEAWSALERRGDLGRELLRWYAATRAGEIAAETALPGAVVERATMPEMHGLSSRDALSGPVPEEPVPHGMPHEPAAPTGLRGALAQAGSERLH